VIVGVHAHAGRTKTLQDWHTVSPKQRNATIALSAMKVNPDPGFIVKVRKKLSLDQREAAEIFGGGVNAFSRYENGKTKPPLALVKLLKVLDRHPDLLDEIKVA